MHASVIACGFSAALVLGPLLMPMRCDAETYATWRWRHFASWTNVAGALGADPDGDGHNNFVEYALRGSPLAADGPLFRIELAPPAGATPGSLRAVYARQTDAELSCWVEQSPALGSLSQWAADGVGPEQPLDGTATVYRVLGTGPTPAAVSFARLRIEQPASLLDATFEGDTAGDAELPLTHESPGGTQCRILTEAGSTNRCLHLVGGSSAETWPRTTLAIPPQTGAFTCSWRINRGSTSALEFALLADRVACARLQVAIDGALRAGTDTNVLSVLPAATWCRLAWVVNVTQQTAEVWVNGVRRASGLPLATNAQSYAWQAAAGDAQLDDVRVHQGRHPVSGEDIPVLLGELDAQYDAFLPWLASLYSSSLGGFYHALSSRTDTNRFRPTIETTGQALSILEDTGLLDTMPATIKDALLTFFATRQDPDGYYRDRIADLDRSTSQLGRNLSYARHGYRRLTAVPASGSVSTNPPYAEPNQSAVEAQYPELASPEAFAAWLAALPWSNPYSAGGSVQTRCSSIVLLPATNRASLEQTLVTFLDGIQSPTTGFWGTDPTAADYNYLSGAFKICLSLYALGLPIPCADAQYASSLACLRGPPPDRYVYLRNALSMFGFLRGWVSRAYPPHEIAEAGGLTVAANAHFLQADGGFSRYWDRAVTGDVIALGLGLREGDINSGVQAIGPVRENLYQLLDRPAPPLRHVAGFYEQLSP